MPVETLERPDRLDFATAHGTRDGDVRIETSEVVPEADPMHSNYQKNIDREDATRLLGASTLQIGGGQESMSPDRQGYDYTNDGRQPKGDTKIRR